MVMTDPIADMLTRIRNANQMRHEVVEMPASKIKHQILSLMQEEGYINSVEVLDNSKHSLLRVSMKYAGNERVIKGIKRISKPGLRVYAKADELPKVLSGLGIAIISTSKGVVTDKVARQQQVGGEVLAYVW